MGFLKTADELSQIEAMKTADFYDVEMLILYWETTPEIISRLLPPPLKPVAKPLVMAFIANYRRTSFGPGYFEGALFLRSQYNGQPGNYCLSMPVTGDIAMALGREKYGFPKKMAKISLERTGTQVNGRMSRCGTDFFTVTAQLDHTPNARDFPLILAEATAPNPDCARSYNFKYMLAAQGSGFTGFDHYPFLVQSETILQSQEMLFGSATIKMQPSVTDPWHEIAVARMVGAVYMTGSTSLRNGTVLAKVDPQAYAPYAYLRWDW